MKRIFAILIVLLLWTMPLVAFAEDVPIETETVEGDNSTTVEETPTEGEISLPVTISEQILAWCNEYLDKIIMTIFLIFSAIWEKSRDKRSLKAMGTLNNNAVSIAENSSNIMSRALTHIEGASGAVTGYRTEMALLLEAYRNTAEDKARLERELLDIHKDLKLAKAANVEFANELAELLALANIPNYKKEEIGARHLAAVNAIAVAEAKTETEEVKEDVGEET